MTAPTKDLALAQRINATVRAAVLKTHSPASCIASIFVLREVLRIGYGINLEPRATQVLIFNPFVTTLMRTSKLRGQHDLIDAVRSTQGWSVGIGTGSIEDEYPQGNRAGLHLVGITRTASAWWLWDPSLDQASRPEKQIYLNPVVHEIPEDIYEAPDDFGAVQKGSLVIYRAKQAAEDVLQRSPDWDDAERFKSHITGALKHLAQEGYL